MTKQRPCRQCGTPFAVVNGGQRYCTTCREQRAAIEAAKPLRKCAFCDNLARPLHKHRCPTCVKAHAEQQRQMIRERQRQALNAKLTTRRVVDADDDTLRQRYDQLFASLPPEEQALHCAILLVGLLSAIQRQNEQLPPEEQPHDDQPTIDATFYQLMGDIEL